METKNTIQLNIKIKGVHPIYLDRYIYITKNKLKKLGLCYNNLVFLPKKISRFTVLRSPHVDKKSREQFEKIIYKRSLNIMFDNSISNTSIILYKVISLLTESSPGIELKISYNNITKTNF